MHIVKCVYCQEQFDRDQVKCQKVGRRYAHITCNEPKIDVDGTNYNSIIQYSKIILGEGINFIKISKQIKEYITQGMTYKGIYLTLKYWYEIKKENTAKSNGGIGIVPYVYKEARDYWKSIEPKRVPNIKEEEIIITPRKRKKIQLGMGDEIDG